MGLPRFFRATMFFHELFCYSLCKTEFTGMKLRVRLSEPRCDRVIQLEGSCATVNLGQVIDEIKHELNV